MWQFEQGTLTCAPVSGNDVLLWSNVAGCQAIVVWQVEQVVGMPALTCGGLVVPL
jgi:hypothetical protein